MARPTDIERAVAGDFRALAVLDGDLDRLVLQRNWAGVNDVLDPLAHAAAAGAEPALVALLTLVDSHRLAHGPIRKVLLDTAQIEDAAQDTLATISRKISSFQGRSRFTTWLHPVAANAAKQLIRRERRHADQPSEALPELAPGLRRLSSMVTDRELLESVIAQLPEEFRVAVELRELHHLSYQEIADHLGVELGTVKSRLSRGKQLAREALAELR